MSINLSEGMVDDKHIKVEKPGAVLAAKRLEKGYSIEYVADKLHLRAHIIEYLEADDYQRMAAAVFIKGYLRSYAKVLDIPAEPLIESFDGHYTVQGKPGMLWQSRKQTHRAENAIRWVTAVCALGVVIAVFVWWQANKENEQAFKVHLQQAAVKKDHTEAEVRLTDLSKMRQLLHNDSLVQGGNQDA